MKFNTKYIYIPINVFNYYNTYNSIISNNEYDYHIKEKENKKHMEYNDIINNIEITYSKPFIMNMLNIYLEWNKVPINSKKIRIYVNHCCHEYISMCNKKINVYGEIRSKIKSHIRNSLKDIIINIKDFFNTHFFICNFVDYYDDPPFKIIIYYEHNKRKNILSNIEYKNSINNINDFIIENNYYNNNNDNKLYNIIDISNGSILYYDKEIFLNM